MFVLLFLSNEQLLKALSLVWYLIGNHKKVGHLWDLEGARERLELVRADLLEEGSFDDAVMACEGVFHTASPILTKSESKVMLITRSDHFTCWKLKTFHGYC
jgi:hypothetical protein